MENKGITVVVQTRFHPDSKCISVALLARGTESHVYVPVEEIQDDATRAMSGVVDAMGMTAEWSGCTITLERGGLVLGPRDAAQIRKEFIKELEKEGYEVITG